MKSKPQGFTLIELMVVIAVVGILASIAVRSYSKHVAKSKFTEVISSVQFLKRDVEVCIFDQGWDSIDICSLGNSAYEHGSVGWDLKKYPTDFVTKYVDSINVENGVITAKASSLNNLKSATFVLKPKPGRADVVIWALDSSSTCIELGYC